MVKSNSPYKHISNKYIDLYYSFTEVYLEYSIKHSPATVSALSAILYSAQKLGAQYAWHNPRLKGKSRLTS